MGTMRQLVCVEPADTIHLDVRTVEMPRPAKGEVLVRVEAASVNPIDVKRAKGYGHRLLALKGAGTFPLVLGNDFAGDIVEVGAGITQWQPGDRVMGLVPTGKKGGAHRSHLTVDARLLRPAIGTMSAEALAVFPYTFTTLWLALRGAGITEGNAKNLKVLVYGASGGLGQLALQLLTRWGALVTAVCSTAHIELCRRLGAMETWDRTQRRLEDMPRHFDASLNFGAWEDEAKLVGCLRPGALGHATAVHPLLANIDRKGLFSGAWRSRQDWNHMRALAQAKGARYRWVVFQPDQGALDMLQRLLEQKALTLPVGMTAPLSDALTAFDHVAEQKAGRVALMPHR